MMEEEDIRLRSRNTGKQSKFTRFQWEAIEVQLNESQQRVLRAMSILGGDEKEKDTEDTNIILGEEYVKSVRPRLKFFESTQDSTRVCVETNKKKGGKKNKKHTLVSVKDAQDNGILDTSKIEAWVRSKNNGKISSDDIKTLNHIKRLVKETEAVEATFSPNNLTASASFLSRFLEIRVSALMRVIHYLIQTDKILESSAYEVIVTTDIVIAKLADFNVCEKLIDDINELNTKMKKKVSFTHKKLCQKHPSALLSKRYKVLDSSKIKPYDSQKRFVNLVLENKEVFIRFVSMMGCGKTTTTIALAAMVKSMRKKEKLRKEDTTQLLFVCSDEPVRSEVCKALWNSGITFGISVYDTDTRKADISYNWSCKGPSRKEKQEDNCCVIVSDVLGAKGLLEREKKHILFIDEPTVGADIENSPVTRQLPGILDNAPPVTILCSATLPKEEDISQLIGLYKAKHPNASIQTVESANIRIGTELININTGDVFLPHVCCKTIQDVKRLLERLEEKQVIKRFYTPLITYLMYSVFSRSIDSLPDINDYYSSSSNYTQVAAQEFAIKLLKCLEETNDDEIVKIVCKAIDYSEIRKGKGHTSSSSELNLTTTNAYKYSGGAMVSTSNPMKLAKQMYDSFLSELKLSDYIEETKTEQEKRRTRDNKPRNKIDDIEYGDDTDETRILFPADKVINSVEHARKYGGTLSRDSVRTQLDIIKEIRAINEEEWLLLLLLSGVGVYQRNENPQYSELVLKLASKGELAYVITDGASMCYGTNYPFTHVIVEDDSIAEEHSVDTLFQLISRGGRVGKRSLGVAHVGDGFIKKISEYVVGPLKPPIEAINMEKAANEYIHSKRQTNEKKLKKDNSRVVSSPILIPVPTPVPVPVPMPAQAAVPMPAQAAVPMPAQAPIPTPVSVPAQANPIVVVNKDHTIVSIGKVKEKASKREQKPMPMSAQDKKLLESARRREKKGVYVPPALRNKLRT